MACRPPEPPPACFSRRRLKHGCEHSFDRPTIYRASEAHNDGNKGLGVGGSVLTSARVTGTGFTRARLLRSSRVPGKGGELTKAGHALQKHGGRPGSKFRCPKGDEKVINAEAEAIINDILVDPTKVVRSNTGRFGETVDIYGSGGQGVRFNTAGDFIGFLE